MKPLVYIRVSPRLKKKLYALCYFVILLGSLWLGAKALVTAAKQLPASAPLNASALVDKTVAILAKSGLDFKAVFFNSLPILSTTASAEVFTGSEWGQESLVESAINAVTDLDLQNPASFLGSQLTLLKIVNPANSQAGVNILEDTEGEYIPELGEDILPEEDVNNAYQDPKNFITSDKPLVAIYNTHNAETYRPTDGKDKIEGKNAGVATVAAKLAEALEAKQVKTIRSTAIHDYPSFAQSYGNSEKTVRSMLQSNPSIQVVIDVHRDVVNKRETVKINGKDTAKIMLILGSNARLAHPNWEKNKLFAEQVVQKMDQIYPGLAKGLRVQSGRYNQHLHPNAILLEVGSVENSQEEAERAVVLFADVIIHVLADLQKNKI